MTTYFVTRHKGALDWAREEGIEAVAVDHLDTSAIQKGDTVIGTLPVSLIANICARGATYHHLVIDIPAEERGRELTAESMRRFNARLETYEAKRVHK